MLFNSLFSMNSVTATEKAKNYDLAYSEEVEREREDQENLTFYEQREALVRNKSKRARERVLELQQRENQLEISIDRLKRLRRTKSEFWSSEDLEWWQRTRGIIQ